jgi:tRNA1Val (adenine37-N6)-methyltransferase
MSLSVILHHNEGLLFSRLMELIKENLVQDGHFFLLLPYKRNEEIIRFLKGNDFTANKIVLVKPTVNSNYFRILLHGSLNKKEHNETILDEIVIKNEHQEYTSSFTRLLKDYYLYL